MPLLTTGSNSKSVNLPSGFCTKLMAALDDNQTRSSKGLKRKRNDDTFGALRGFLAQIADDDGEHDNDNDYDGCDDDTEDDEDDDTTWIGCWVDKPPGERGRLNRPDRPGWGKPEIMEAAGITEEQYTRYMKSVHRLCGRYFDITMNFHDNKTTRPTQYGLIIEKMKELHPRFQFHTGDWITRHLLITHCQATSRSFGKLGDDPDLKVYAKYMNKQKKNKQKEAQKTLKKRRIGSPMQLALPVPKALRKSKEKNSVKPQGSFKTKKRKVATLEPEAVTLESEGESEDIAMYEALAEEASSRRANAATSRVTYKTVTSQPRHKPRPKYDTESDSDAGSYADAVLAPKHLDKGKAKAVNRLVDPAPRRSARAKKTAVNTAQSPMRMSSRAKKTAVNTAQSPMRMSSSPVRMSSRAKKTAVNTAQSPVRMSSP